ncbi:hypothetical protein [Sulfobacillus harzensis]|uniref:Transposase TnpC homeodomain domain-containing protein n=1 Tax=Sulfobacillus harzensis TaxID=2729629 RepID=A0A7Y0L2F4_9FIRM|nr:hypothetical protein [Sulfobacillus harzensis]NMP22058.1 hypothetical protein [Sulfobacillus harzensis]
MVLHAQDYVRQIEEQIRLSQHPRFDASSERSDAAQLRLFNETEVTAVPAVDARPVEAVTYERHKKMPGQRDAAWDQRPVERIEYRPEE